MLISLRSICRSLWLTASLAVLPRGLGAVAYVRLTLAVPGTALGRVMAGPDKVGGVTGLMVGGGIAGVVILPAPLGFMTEPLRPRAFPGPSGIPLIPVSWADARKGAATRQRSASVSSVARSMFCRQRKIEPRSADLMVVAPFRTVLVEEGSLQAGAGLPMNMADECIGRKSLAPRR
jgi:hypothetical protein